MRNQSHKTTKMMGRRTSDPASILKQDHKKIKELFKQFEEAEGAEIKGQIVRKAIQELKIHTTVEQEVFYTAVKNHFQGDEEMQELINEAYEEHHAVDLLIDELEKMDPSEERFDAKFMVLIENVKHHIKEEEQEMFPKSRKELKDNWEEIGEHLKERKNELQSEIEPELEESEESE